MVFPATTTPCDDFHTLVTLSPCPVICPLLFKPPVITDGGEGYPILARDLYPSSEICLIFQPNSPGSHTQLQLRRNMVRLPLSLRSVKHRACRGRHVLYILGRVTRATKDLLEKRGDIYSGRPVIPFS